MLIEHRDGFISSHDGLKLYEQSWIPEGEQKGLLLFVHGYGEHSDRYRNIAEYFVPHKWVIFTFDNRGHGRSGGTRAHIANFDDYLNDLALMVRRANDIGKGKPVFLIGHSLGGLISALFLATRETKNIKGVILSSPMFRLAVKVPAWKKHVGLLMSGIYPSLALDNGIKPEWLSHDDTVVMRYERDPMVNNIATARWFSEATRAMEKIKSAAANIKMPLLLMQGGDDKLVDPKGAEEIFKLIGSEDKTLKIYEGYYHEVFNEIGRMQVYDEMSDWLDEH